MAGWTCPDKALIRWDGTIEAIDGFLGDGSRLTNVGIGAEADPIFQAASAAYNTHLASEAIHFSISEGSNVTFNKVGTNIEIASTGGGGGGESLWTSGANHIYPIYAGQIISGAGITTAGHVSGANISVLTSSGAQAVVDHKSLSGAYNTHAASTAIHFVNTGFLTAEADPKFQAASAAYNTHLASTAIHFRVGDISHTNITNIGTKTHAVLESSGAQIVIDHKSLSGAYTTHAATSSNPHGAALTQTNLNATNISGAKIVMTADHTTSAAAYCVNVIMASTATPPTASGYPQGTIYLQYTA